VTGSIGESETVTPAEEVANILATDTAESRGDFDVDMDVGAGRTVAAQADEAATPPRDVGADPWQALLQIGAQFVAALAAADRPEAPEHPWVQRDPTTCGRSLKMPLPPPEAAR